MTRLEYESIMYWLGEILVKEGKTGEEIEKIALEIYKEYLDMPGNWEFLGERREEG